MTKYEIEIPDQLLVVDGKQFEPTGEYRIPIRDEWFLDGYGCVQCKHDIGGVEFIILRELQPPWKWPDELFSDDVVAIGWVYDLGDYMFFNSLSGIKWDPPPENRRYKRPKK